MKLIPETWLPEVKMKRIITHWTGGSYKASDNDKSHYHIIVEDDGNIIRGKHSISDNVSTADGNYAQHTGGANTGSIGVSVCCMGGDEVKESPFIPGNYPMTLKQWETMAQVVAELAEKYDIPVTNKTILGHGEVYRYLGENQDGKWDPMILPWDPHLSKTEVGDIFRATVQRYLEGEIAETMPKVKVIINNHSFDEAYITNEGVYLKIRPIADVMGWIINKIEERSMEIQIGDKIYQIPIYISQGIGLVSARKFAKKLDGNIQWQHEAKTVIIKF